MREGTAAGSEVPAEPPQRGVGGGSGRGGKSRTSIASACALAQVGIGDTGPHLLDVRQAIVSGEEGGGEALSVLEALASAGAAVPGTTILDEVEQGWRLRAVAAPGSLLLVEWDGEGPPPAGEGWRLDAARLAAQAAAARDRLRRSHARLRRLLGRDLWS